MQVRIRAASAKLAALGAATILIVGAVGPLEAAKPRPTPTATPIVCATASPIPTPVPTTTPVPFTTIQAAVTAAPAGATINIPAGTYRESVSAFKAGQTLKFAPGAVIDGRDASGTLVRSRWLLIDANNVTIQGGSFLYAANVLSGNGALEIAAGITGTRILGGEFAYARGPVVKLGGSIGTLLDGVDIHHGGYLGLHFGGGTDNIVRNSKIRDNNAPRPYESYMASSSHYIPYGTTGLYYVDSGWESGGAKGIAHTRMVFEGNDVYGNYGPGLWSDSVPSASPHSKDWIVRNNRLHDNTGSGLFVEVTDGAEVYGNVAYRNGGAASLSFSAPYQGGNITVSSSRRVNVYDNVIYGGRLGINYFAQPRSDSPGHGEVRITDNDFIASEPDWLALTFATDGPDMWATSSGANNRFYYPVAENGKNRFAYLGWRTTLAGLNGTAGGSGTSRYLTAAEAQALQP